MPDILVQFDEPQLSADGRMFTAQIVASRLPTGVWEAWMEFLPRVGGDPVRTETVTEQLSRGDLRFWAAGLTRADLKAALARALAPAEPDAAAAPDQSTDQENGTGENTVLNTNRVRNDEPALDPVAVYERSGEYILRQELRALDARQLADIISGHGIEEMDVLDLARTYEDALAERIVAGVQHSVARKHTDPPPTDARITK
jgi:hypothetical protein